MKRFFLVFFVMVLITVFAESCKKDEAEPPAITRANIAGSYKITSFTRGTSTDLLNPCEKDDVLIFNANKTFTWSDAGSKCNPDGTFNYIWDLPSTLKVLMLDVVWDLDKFDGKALELSAPAIDDSTAQYIDTYYIKLQKQ